MGLDRLKRSRRYPMRRRPNWRVTAPAGVPQGGRVLVHGAAGALASVFPPIARRLGASEVVGTVRSADRIAEAEGLGFDRVVVSEDPLGVDSHERFDIIVDPVGGVQRPELLALLAQMGRLIAVGSADSRSGKTVDTNDLWFNNTGIVGFLVGNFLAEYPAAAAVSAADALEVIAEGSIVSRSRRTRSTARPTHTHAWKPERCLAVLSWTSSKGPDYS